MFSKTKHLNHQPKNQKGQGLVEYALILVLVAVVVIGVMALLGGNVSEVYRTINETFNSIEAPVQQSGADWLLAECGPFDSGVTIYGSQQNGYVDWGHIQIPSDTHSVVCP